MIFMTSDEIMLNIHGILPHTEANGPGCRCGIWFQGCSLGCKDCFNPETHPHEPNHLVPIEDLVKWVLSLSVIEGVSISGGEPFEQAEGLSLFLKTIKRRTNHNSEVLSVLVYTGYEIDFLTSSPDKNIQEAMSYIDILCAGPFIEELRNDSLLWCGSLNQQLHYLTDRYGQWMEKEWKIHVPSEEITIAGVKATKTGFNVLAHTIPDILRKKG